MEQRISVFVVRDVAAGLRQEYSISYWEGMTVLEALHHIWTELDPSLAYSHACRVGTCGACEVDLDGRTVLACHTPVASGSVIGPSRNKRPLRDVVAVMDQSASSIEGGLS